MSQLIWMQAGEEQFPPTHTAFSEPDGLLAAGGDLSPSQLIAAYQQGIFPWYNEDQPILWWSPSTRLVLFPQQLHVSRSMAKLIKKRAFRVSTDECFEAVMRACAAQPRADQDGTWINEDMIAAYVDLHHLGYAHSVEVWQDDELVGGLYGLAMGKLFFGESMFSRRSNASKYGFICMVLALMAEGFGMIDCQVHTPHLESLGACEISREQFEEQLERFNAREACLWPSLFKA